MQHLELKIMLQSPLDTKSYFNYTRKFDSQLQKFIKNCTFSAFSWFETWRFLSEDFRHLLETFLPIHSYTCR